MHSSLRRAWDRVRGLAKEVRLQVTFRNSRLIPLWDAVDIAIAHLPPSARDEIYLPDYQRSRDVAERSYVANSIACFFPLWGRLNGRTELGSIDFGVSGRTRSYATDDCRLVFSSIRDGWFTDLHVRRRYVLAWILWLRDRKPPTWREREPARFYDTPENPDPSVMERQGKATDFDDSEVIALLVRKLEAMDKIPKPVLDVGKPKKRWRKRLRRR